MVRHRSDFFLLRVAAIWIAFWPIVPIGGAARAAPPGIALVIGNAAYTEFPPVPACAQSARTVAAALNRLGFEVTERIDAASGAISAALAELARKLDATPMPAVLYACGYGAGLNDRAFLLPAGAKIRQPPDVLAQGILAKAVLDAVARGGAMPSVFALDLIARPGDNTPSGLEGLAPTKVSPALASIAARSPMPEGAETAFGAALAKMFADPVVRSDGLVTNMDTALWGSAAMLEVQQLPPSPGYVAGAPKPLVPPVASPGTVVILPDESRMTEKDRREVQAALARIGLYKGPVTGRFDDATRSAINVFQIKLGVPMTGHLTGPQATRLLATDR